MRPDMLSCSSWQALSTCAPLLQLVVPLTPLVLLVLLALWYVRRWRKMEVDRTPRRVIITGAATGIGRALAEELAVTYGDSIIALDRDKRRLDELETWALRNGHSVLCVQCDVADAASVARAATELQAQQSAHGKGCIHAIINLAGIYALGPLMEESSVDKLDLVMRVNVLGTLRVVQAFHHYLPTSSSSPAENGRILFMGSELSTRRIATGLTAPYTMSKWALEAYVASLRQELQCMLNKPKPVHACMVSLGAVTTGLSVDAPINQALELIDAGSKWSAALHRLVASTQSFHESFAVPTSTVAPEIAEIVHAVRPPSYSVINSSWPLRLASWLPHSILDNQAKKKQLGTFLATGRPQTQHLE